MTKPIAGHAIIDGLQKSTRDLIGQRLNKLTILDIKKESKSRTWCTCQCDCGEVVKLRLARIKDGICISCGCHRFTAIKPGTRFDRLTVIGRGISKFKSKPYFPVVCDCGKEKFVSAHSLLTGYTKSCGCLRNEKCAVSMNPENLTGRRVGLLTVLREVPNDRTRHTSQNRHRMWECKCDCGTVKLISRHLLVAKKPQLSCGCLKSYGQKQISNILNKLGIEFQSEYTKHGIPQVTMRKHKIDFYLPKYDVYIEFHGPQHYKGIPIGLWGIKTEAQSKTKLMEQQMRDAYVRKYLGSKLLEIPHWESDNIETIILEKIDYVTRNQEEVV